MKITRTSVMTGNENTLDLDIDPVIYEKWVTGEGYVQDQFPHLTDDEREFLLSGLYPGEFDELFGEEE